MLSYKKNTENYHNLQQLQESELYAQLASQVNSTPRSQLDINSIQVTGSWEPPGSSLHLSTRTLTILATTEVRHIHEHNRSHQKERLGLPTTISVPSSQLAPLIVHSRWYPHESGPANEATKTPVEQVSWGEKINKATLWYSVVTG
jgi:hypothetical protein